MKKISFICLLFGIILCFASCSNKETPQTVPEVTTSSSVVEVTEPFISVNVVRDTNGNILQHILFNKQTKDTYIYDYRWEYNYGEFVCKGSWLTIIEAEDKNESEDETNNILGNQTIVVTPSTDNNDTPPPSTFDAVTILDKNNIKVIITDYSYDPLFKQHKYKVKIENNSIRDIYISTSKETLNGMLMDDEIGFAEWLDAGTSTITSITIWDDDLKEFEISNFESLTMNLEVDDPNDMFNNYFTEFVELSFIKQK
jgi:hypothetical protein